MVEYLKANPLLIGALITAVAGLLLAFLNFLFTRWNDKRKRDLEIRNRQIEDARNIVRKWASFVYFVREVAKILSEEKNLERITSRLASYDEEFKSIPSMRHEAKINESSIKILDDKKLLDLNTELSQKAQLSMEVLATLHKNIDAINYKLDTISVTDNLGGKKPDLSFTNDITKDMNLERLIETLDESNEIITKMKARLDKLAKS